MRYPAIAPLQRKKIQETQSAAVAEAQVQQQSQSFTLRSTGRVIRSVSDGEEFDKIIIVLIN